MEPTFVIPETSEVERALLFYLADFVTPKSAQYAYRTLAQQFGLNQTQRAQRMPNQAESHWENRVRTARNQLVQKGYLDNTRRDEWMLTPSGREYVNLVRSIDIDL